MSKQLDGRTIFLSGAGGVLGSTYITRMLDQGAKVVATDLPGHRADALKEAHGTNPSFAYYDLDMANEDEIVEIFRRIAADGWEPNVVLNNAAITGELLMGAGQGFPDFADTTLETWERRLSTSHQCTH